MDSTTTTSEPTSVTSTSSEQLAPPNRDYKLQPRHNHHGDSDKVPPPSTSPLLAYQPPLLHPTATTCTTAKAATAITVWECHRLRAATLLSPFALSDHCGACDGFHHRGCLVQPPHQDNATPVQPPSPPLLVGYELQPLDGFNATSACGSPSRAYRHHLGHHHLHWRVIAITATHAIPLPSRLSTTTYCIFFISPGCYCGYNFILGIRYARRLYEDNKMEEARKKGIELESPPDAKAEFLGLLSLHTISLIWAFATREEYPIWLRPYIYKAWTQAFHSR